jgi:hypothetical protein
MKRSEMLKFITDELFYGSLAARVDNSNTTVTELAEKDAEAVLKLIEKFGMFYCPVEDLGDFGRLRTPKGWEPEDDLP